MLTNVIVKHIINVYVYVFVFHHHWASNIALLTSMYCTHSTHDTTFCLIHLAATHSTRMIMMMLKIRWYAQEIGSISCRILKSWVQSNGVNPTVEEKIELSRVVGIGYGQICQYVYIQSRSTAISSSIQRICLPMCLWLACGRWVKSRTNTTDLSVCSVLCRVMLVPLYFWCHIRVFIDYRARSRMGIGIGVASVIGTPATAHFVVM